MAAIDVAVLAERLDRVEAENRVLRTELEDLRARSDPAPDRPEVEDLPVSRRALFGKLAGAAAAGGVAAIAGSTITATPAAADHHDGFGHANPTGAEQTSVTGTRPADSVMSITNTGAGGYALYGSALEPSGMATPAAIVGDSHDVSGLAGFSTTDHGVRGVTTGSSKAGVHGVAGVLSLESAPAGVHGDSVDFVGVLGSSTHSTGVHGKSDEWYAVVAEGGKAQVRIVPGDTAGAPTPLIYDAGDLYLDSASVLWICTAGTDLASTWVRNITGGENRLGTSSLIVRHTGTVSAVYAHNSNGTRAAVRGVHDAKGPGVQGESAANVGGRFLGKTAQVQLVPSTADTHPPQGSPGDLFVDSTKRLWFCKGGTDWHLLV